MLKKIATGVLAVAATTAVALSLPAAASAAAPAAASASAPDYAEPWGPVHSRNYLAKAQGRVVVDWDRHGKSNEVHVAGRLYDLDPRTYRRGGKCAFVVFEASDFDHDWYPVHREKHCGYPGYERFAFHEEDVYSLRAKVCQAPPRGGFPTKCGRWEYLYTAESE